MNSEITRFFNTVAFELSEAARIELINTIGDTFGPEYAQALFAGAHCLRVMSIKAKDPEFTQAAGKALFDYFNGRN